MKYFILLIVLISFGFSFSDKLEVIDLVVEKRLQIKKDSIVISYWKSIEANEYYFKYCNDFLEIRSLYFDFEKEILDKMIIKVFSDYINLFYIDKTERIILRKINRGYMESTHAPKITVVAYNDGKKVFKEEISLGDEEYEITFNPKFLEFYRFLDCLVTRE